MNHRSGESLVLILGSRLKGAPPHDCCFLLHASCSLLCSWPHPRKVRSVGAVTRGGAGVGTGAELCRLNRGYLREIPRYILIYPGKSGDNKRLKIMTENPGLAGGAHRDHDRDYLRHHHSAHQECHLIIGSRSTSGSQTCNKCLTMFGIESVIL